MADKNGELSFEDLTEIRRKEENSSYLSEIRDDFYSAAQAVIKSDSEKKNKVLVENPDMYDGISSRAKKTSAVIDRIIFVRMNKIGDAALRNASGDVKDVPENMTKEEKAFYLSMYEIHKKPYSFVRSDSKPFVPNIETVPASPEIPMEKPKEEPVNVESEIVKEEPKPIINVRETVPEPAPSPVCPDYLDEEMLEEPATPVAETGPIVLEEDEVVIRVLEDLPTFSGPERNYTLKKEDIVRLPSIMASALINRHKAVLVKTTV